MPVPRTCCRQRAGADLDVEPPFQRGVIGLRFGVAPGLRVLRLRARGIGRYPRGWSHGLGLGGVRKRVKQLGGEVEWREATPHGISCRVVIRELSARP